MPEVFYNDAAVIQVGNSWITTLKDAARASPRHRARLCMHRSQDDAVQEMIIALLKPALFPPTRHVRKTKSYHMIEGELCVLLFDDRGASTQAIHLAAPGGRLPFYYRLSEGHWNTTVPLSDVVVYHEIIEGPFTPSSSSLAAPWAPAQPEALRFFLQHHLAEMLAPANESNSAGSSG